ncbi:uncharacterized protein MEPE_00600 [Melanopsichium pennsylvanicum]|uniref:Uncharacterized protein n=2 Tax=Melanopsichium pennsylvanicum TaxID=63383 RepID=A0AAJ4XGZ1_9BASI|nr:conserved hypothetical protein [Melanopsichium pennsylvanicum 4]SNX81895.1 uncharacterized protein MEPE_00600 [Melanopsichium pennsylvanicum]
MSRSHGTVIDLTEESPPAHIRSRPPTTITDTHILDWSSGSHHVDRPSSRVTTTNAASSSSGTRPSRPVAETIVLDSDDEDDDTSFTITGQSQPVRRAQPLFRSSSNPSSTHRPSGPASASSLRFHDGIGRGPHNHGSLISQGPGILGASSSGFHPLLPPRRAAISSSSATAARRSGGGTTTGSDASFMSRLGGDFNFGGFGFGTTFSMELIGSLMHRLHSSGGGGSHQSAQNKVPQEYDRKWTHPYEAQPGFTHSIIEPPVDLDTYFDDKAVVTGPLPDTTPICPCCRHALVTGANGDQRIWVLPCGHVIDGRCLDRLSGLTDVSDVHSTPSKGTGKGKAKAIDPPEAEPPAKASRTSSRTRATQAAHVPVDSPPKKPKKPKRFECPIQGCEQKCTKDDNSKYSAWAVFV